MRHKSSPPLDGVILKSKAIMVLFFYPGLKGVVKIKIKKNTNQKTKVKFPYRVYLDNGRIVPVPSQYKFKSDYIRTHGCSLVGFYMALRFLGVKKSMAWCKKYMDKNHGLNGHAKFNLRQVSAAINEIDSSKPAIFKRSPSAATIRSNLKSGNLILFEEKKPIHTAVLLQIGAKIKRFSDGHYNNVTVTQEVKKRCGDAYYGGCIIIKK